MMAGLPTLYVAGPMTGIPDHNYPEFLTVSENLRGCGYIILNPADVDAIHKAELRKITVERCGDCEVGRAHTWQWYMRRTVKMLCDADGIALLRGWRGSRGAMAEVNLGRALGMEVMPWQNWALRAREGESAPKGKRTQPPTKDLPRTW